MRDGLGNEFLFFFAQIVEQLLGLGIEESRSAMLLFTVSVRCVVTTVGGSTTV